MTKFASILGTVGNTPVVKINKLAPPGINLYVKVEAFNPLGSVKDRLALGIIEDAEKKGTLKPGQTVCEATSGNTGIGLAMVCAAKGYPLVVTMAESFSVERRRLMRFLGAKVILTPAPEGGTGMVRKANELAKKNGWFLTRQFENEAIYVDRRIAEKKDFVFLNYIEAIRWVMTDVALFDGVLYDSSHQRDHFFADNFRQYCDGCAAEGRFITYEELQDRVERVRSLDPVLRFFDSLQRSEDRLRWDRLVALHLLLMAFVNSFGYQPQYSSQTHFDSVAGQVRRPQILENLVDWLPRHGLGKDKESRRIVRACQTLKKRTLRRNGVA